MPGARNEAELAGNVQRNLPCEPFAKACAISQVTSFHLLLVHVFDTASQAASCLLL